MARGGRQELDRGKRGGKDTFGANICVSVSGGVHKLNHYMELSTIDAVKISVRYLFASVIAVGVKNDDPPSHQVLNALR